MVEILAVSTDEPWRSAAACKALVMAGRGEMGLGVSVGVSPPQLESPPIFLPCQVRVHPDRPAAHPMATGWNEEPPCSTTMARALRVIVLDGSIFMSGHAPPPVPIGNGVTGGPESVRDG